MGSRTTSGVTSPPEAAWTVTTAPLGTVVLRRVLALVVFGLGVALGSGVLAVGLSSRAASPLGWLAVLLVVGAAWLATRVWNAVPRGAGTTTLVARRGTVHVEGREHAVRSCHYDGAADLLWLRGPLRVARAAVFVAREEACAIVDALGCPEHGLRTLSALPGVFVVPIVGSLLALAIACGLLFGVVVLVAGPLHIGAPAAAIAIPLAIVAFRPARIELGERALVWRWWTVRRELPLEAIERVGATAGSLRVQMKDGSVRKLRVRMVSSSGALADALDARARARLVGFASFVESRARRALASVFE